MYRNNLKFKIWDTEEKKWFEPIYRANEGTLLDLSIGLSGDVIRRTLQCSSEHESMFENKYIVCRFTGLKDKSGVEVFEGDIAIPVSTDNDITPFVIKWRDDVYCIVGDSGAEWLMMEEFEGCEIVGNIYEHPHLINP